MHIFSPQNGALKTHLSHQKMRQNSRAAIWVLKNFPGVNPNPNKGREGKRKGKGKGEGEGFAFVVIDNLHALYVIGFRPKFFVQ
jgi:hypothetical protein